MSLRILVLCLPSLLFFACREDARAQSDSLIVGQVDPSQKLAAVETTKGNPLVLRMGEATVAPRQQVCLPVEASNFQDLIGLQFTLRFDSASLAYQSVRKLGLPGYGSSNFGTRFAERGYLSNLWMDQGLQGVSRPDGHLLFEACFLNLMEAGESTEVKFQDGPTRFEVVSKGMEKRSISYANGKVISR